MGEAEVAEFLTHLASDKHVSASTQNQALQAILFLYREVLARPVGFGRAGSPTMSLTDCSSLRRGSYGIKQPRRCSLFPPAVFWQSSPQNQD